MTSRLEGINISTNVFREGCDITISILNGSIHADYKLVKDASSNKKGLKLIRISFDGFGCCNCRNNSALPLSATDSAVIMSSADKTGIDEDGAISSILRNNFHTNRSVIWEDALERYKLL
jgi:hypothetical protein